VPGSGLVYDLGSHLIDQALVLFGKPERVTAFLQNVGQLGDVEDNVSISPEGLSISFFTCGTYSLRYFSIIPLVLGSLIPSLSSCVLISFQHEVHNFAIA
jgi:predicted dehydrogenase